MNRPLVLAVVTAGAAQSAHSTTILVVGTLTSLAFGGYAWRRIFKTTKRITHLEERMDRIENPKDE